MAAGPTETPPQSTTQDGETRRVGVEIEFANVKGADAAELVRRCFSGKVDQVDVHRYQVTDTEWGEFVVELDTQYVHRDEGDEEGEPGEAKPAGERVREIIGEAAALVVPYEIVCPPIPWNELESLSPLFDGLRRLGAEGTEESPVYGFGLHLNVELAQLDIAHIVQQFQAYLLMSDWLREHIQIDLTRRLLPHASGFPADYALEVVAPDYRPDLNRFIEDYIAANPSRNRELDLYPLLRHLAPETVDELVDDPLIKARPAWHYRLPNASVSEPGWNAVVEWNRWVEVERLAADAKRLEAMARAYREWASKPMPARWLDSIRDLLQR